MALICRVRRAPEYGYIAIQRGGGWGAQRRVIATGMLFLAPKKQKQPTSVLCRVIGKPRFTDLFSSLGTVNDRLKSEYVKWGALRQIFHEILLSC